MIVVLDTNALIQVFGRSSPYLPAVRGTLDCVQPWCRFSQPALLALRLKGVLIAPPMRQL